MPTYLLASTQWFLFGLASFIFAAYNNQRLGNLSHLSDLPVKVVLVIVASLFGSSLYINKFLQRSPAVPSKDSETLRKFTFYFTVVVSIFVFIRAAFDAVNLPYEWDEIWVLSKWAHNGYADTLTPYDYSNHVLGFIPAAIALKFEASTRIAFRFGALITTILFLISSLVFCIRYARPFTTILFFSNLAANAWLAWYLHSFRGYLTLAFTTSLLTFYVYHQLESNKKPKLSFLIPVLLFLPVNAHTFGGLFSLGMVGFLGLRTFYFWKSYSAQEKKTAFYCLVSWGLTALVVIFIMWQQGKGIRATFDTTLNQAQFSGLALSLMELFCLPLWGFILMVILGGMTYLFYGIRKDTPLANYLFFLLVIQSILLTILTLKEGVSSFSARYLAAYLVPILLLLGERIAHLPTIQIKNILMAISLVLLGILPFRARPWVIEAYTSHVYYENFMDKVKEITSKEGPNCVRYTGNQVYSKVAEKILYRYTVNKEARKTLCNKTYGVHFGIDPIERKVPLPTELTQLTPLYEADHDQKIFELPR